MKFIQLIIYSLSTSLAMILVTTGVFAHQAEIDEHAPLVPIPPYSNNSDAANAANAFEAGTKLIESLSAAQQEQILLAVDADERQGWSNLPAKYVDRSGIKLGDLSDPQIALLFEFLSSSLGEEGYQTVAETLAAEAFLSEDPQASRHLWSPTNYWFAFYGKPSMTERWGWQFGGHHLGINLSIFNGSVNSLSPTFVGTEPARFTYQGQNYEPVVDMHQAGINVFNALDESQQSNATILKIGKDIATGPGKDGMIPALEGSHVVNWSDEQKDLLLLTINEWVSMQPQENANPRMQELAGQLDKTYFAWYGAADGSGENYYRIQGPTLIIELLSITNNVGDTAKGLGHYHTIYRNPTNEYGLADN